LAPFTNVTTYAYLLTYAAQNGKSENWTKIAQRREVNRQAVEKSLEVPQYDIVASVSQSVAVNLHHFHRHDAVNYFLADGRSSDEDDPMKGAQ